MPSISLSPYFFKYTLLPIIHRIRHYRTGLYRITTAVVGDLHRANKKT